MAARFEYLGCNPIEKNHNKANNNQKKFSPVHAKHHI